MPCRHRPVSGCIFREASRLLAGHNLSRCRTQVSVGIKYSLQCAFPIGEARLVTRRRINPRACAVEFNDAAVILGSGLGRTRAPPGITDAVAEAREETGGGEKVSVPVVNHES
jgi:hypothetical protein